jgi:hypothetical protein
METLIRSLEVFAISKDEKKFSRSIDSILNDLSLAEPDETENTDHRWELLKSNFSKLSYIGELLNHYHYILPPNFFNLLEIFTDSLDKTTQIYIKLIEQEDDEESYKEIKENFEKSLDSNSDISKIKYLLTAYNILVPIVEDFRREHKKRKLN